MKYQRRHLLRRQQENIHNLCTFDSQADSIDQHKLGDTLRAGRRQFAEPLPLTSGKQLNVIVITGSRDSEAEERCEGDRRARGIDRRGVGVDAATIGPRVRALREGRSS